MTLQVENFKEVGGPGNSVQGGQAYTLFSKTDSLSEMLGVGYLNGLKSTLNANDLIYLSAIDGGKLAQISSIEGGVVELSTEIYSGVVGTKTGPGEIDLEYETTELTTESGGGTFTLPDGSLGQQKTLIVVGYDGPMDVTPDTPLGYEKMRLTSLGSNVQLVFRSGGWAIIGLGGLNGGPEVV